MLTLRGSDLVRVASLANGQRAGGWLLNTADNTFGPAADFDGNGKAEMVVQSPWGIGFLGVEGGTFRCLGLQPYGTRIGDWYLERGDRIVALGNFAGSSGRAEALIKKG